MNFQEIVHLLVDNGVTSKDFAEGNMVSIIPLVGVMVKVQETIPDDYSSSEYSVVWHFVDHNVYMKLTGFYSSYNNADFDGYDFEEVKPKTKIITYFE